MQDLSFKNKENLFSIINFDEDLFKKLVKVFSYLATADIDESVFTRLSSQSAISVQSLWGWDKIGIDGAYTIFSQLTGNKWNTAEVVSVFENCSNPAEYIVNLFALGESGRSLASFKYKKEYLEKDACEMTRQIITKVGTHLIGAAFYMNEVKYNAPACSKEEFISILESEIFDMMDNGSIGAHTYYFKDNIENLLPIIRLNLQLIKELN